MRIPIDERGKRGYVRGGPPRALGEALTVFLRRRGLLRELEDHRLVLDWERVVGPALVGQTRPFRVERGVLWIGVNNAPQANHLLYLKKKLLTRIKELYPDSRIRDVRILHRPSAAENR